MNLDPPPATESERHLLDQLERLTHVMAAALAAGDDDTLWDALDESIAVDGRLRASRDNTWAVWWAPHAEALERIRRAA